MPNMYRFSRVLIVLLLLFCLPGCIENQENEAGTEKSTYSKPVLPNYETGLAAPLKDGNPDVEVRLWHQKNQKPFIISERFMVWKQFDDKPEWGKWLDEELWKWEWRDGWEPAPGWQDKKWEGSWYLVPVQDKVEQIRPRMPYPDVPKNIGFYDPENHHGKEWPFGAVEGEFWYWNDNHWELGPAW